MVGWVGGRLECRGPWASAPICPILWIRPAPAAAALPPDKGSKGEACGRSFNLSSAGSGISKAKSGRPFGGRWPSPTYLGVGVRGVEAGPVLPFPEGPGLPAPFHVPSHTCSLPDVPAFSRRQPLATTPPPSPLSRWLGWRRTKVERGKTWKRLEAREGHPCPSRWNLRRLLEGDDLQAGGRQPTGTPRTQAGPVGAIAHAPPRVDYITPIEARIPLRQRGLRTLPWG